MSTQLSPPPGAAAATGARLRIAYLTNGLFSYSNRRTAEQLRLVFPEYDLEEIDVVTDLLRPHKGLVVVNFVHVCRQYWREILSRRFSIRRCFYRTPYLFRKIRELLRRRLTPERHRYAFSIQTQSLYDGSIPGLPHFVYTDHTHLTNLYYPAFPRDLLYARCWIDLEQEVYRHAAHVFVMSEHVRRSLVEHYGCAPADSTCIRAGSNVSATPPALQNDDYGNRTIVFVGIDWHRKGGPTLLQAFDLVLRQMPEARLIIVGCQPAVSHPRIEVTGRVEPLEVQRHLARASVFCLPTRIEPFGIAAVEAFSHRLPVVASHLGALPDLVHEGQSGHLVPPDDAPALAAALLDLLADPEKCRRFAEHGFETVSQRYTWAAVGRDLHQGIAEALARQSVPARA